LRFSVASLRTENRRDLLQNSYKTLTKSRPFAVFHFFGNRQRAQRAFSLFPALRPLSVLSLVGRFLQEMVAALVVTQGRL
jgi:hypothetical protein